MIWRELNEYHAMVYNPLHNKYYMIDKPVNNKKITTDPCLFVVEL